ncbi:MAG: bifunctional folylpolyglutamate synthase/dihydrofolate synthase [Eggerthellaceae bacterium]|nr:bifunctional folylpolyglutamate synthase/dihydrofolate synthase [Eggerthellaceae bacterium]
MSDFDAIEYINAPRWRSANLGLERIRLLLDYLGRPQDSLKFVHVAGTNGKGSTCAYLAKILECSGYRCGLFSSPYIERFEERIRVDGKEISLDELTEVTLRVRECAIRVERETGEHPTEFELMCAVGMAYFAGKSCDIVVLEVGLGGRLDATNVIESPEVCVITPISLEHTDILGDTVEAIAAEKAGIIKDGVPVVCAPQDICAMEVIEKACEDHGCELIRLHDGDVRDSRLFIMDEDEHAKNAVVSDAGHRCIDPYELARRFEYDGHTYTTRLIGSYQPENAALAVLTAQVLRRLGWNITEDSISSALAETVWKGRFEIDCADPLIVIDGAHNTSGIEALTQSLSELEQVMEPTSVTFVIGILRDKKYEAMLSMLSPYGSSFVFYTVSNSRALPAEELASTMDNYTGAPVKACSSPYEAMTYAKATAQDRGIIVACGSLYSISELRKAI